MKRRHHSEASLFDLLPKPPEPPLPPGFVDGPLPGTVSPTSGAHAGVPMLRESALFKVLLKEQERCKLE